jgi:uncharacterized protein (DUF433 family)
MVLNVGSENVPLTLDSDGTMRVGGTRVTLDAVVGLFDEGLTPEQIVDEFDALRLDDVYATITYYLRHRDDVANYLRQRASVAESVRAHADSRASRRDLRKRLLARRRSSQSR